MIRHQKQLQKIARQTLKKYGQAKTPVDIKKLSEQMHIPILPYSDMSSTQRELYLDEISSPAIAVCSGTVHTIYFDSSRPDCDHWIAHELAHIILDHKTDSEENERDANFLSHYLRYQENHFKQYITAFLTGVAIAFVIGFFCAINLSSQNTTSTVYIAPSGEKYHMSKSCAGSNAVSIPLDTAQALQKSPCLMCVDRNK